MSILIGSSITKKEVVYIRYEFRFSQKIVVGMLLSEEFLTQEVWYLYYLLMIGRQN